ncbi:MAG TPA: ATP-dependent helicase HrpB [Xanthomonadales bacterium]|nr:ATP-dependent helicase HrpB [Xanthomonadales bacterium]
MPASPSPNEFPIAPLLPALRDALAAHARVVLEAPPGAGKTTQVPPALLDAPWLAGRIVMLEPRRIAARAAAEFIARGLGEPVGETAGYRIRGESRTSARTRIEVVTEAILTRMIQDDPLLGGVGALLFDEFHERNLHSDLGLALALDAQREVRPDLRIVVMSATLEGERLARFLDAPRLASAGRAFPVEIAWVAQRKDEPWQGQARRAIELALAETGGDVLVFLPGKAEIERLHGAIAAALAERGIATLRLHGELELAAQREALAPPPAGTRRVVLATNVAESSVTLPAVTAVVDTGLAREPRFDPASGMSRLETVAISQASATQRSGRAGRVAPGRAYRLWPESTRLAASIRPEILNVELSPLALELAAWGSDAPRFLDPPPAGPLAEARERLASLGALEAGGRITPHGRALLSLATHPRLGHALLAAPRELASLACDVAALVEARDPLRREARRSDDLRARLLALARFRRDGRAPPEAERGALFEIDRQARELSRRARIVPAPYDAHEPLGAGRVLALAYPDRIARQGGGDGLRYQLANGRGARLHPDSALRGEPWLVAGELRYDEREALVLRGAPVDEAFLREHYAARFTREVEVGFERASRGLIAHDVTRFDALVLARRSVPPPRDARATAALLDGIRALGLAALPWTDALRQWQARAESLRAWLPELGLPALDDAALLSDLEAWLAPWLAGKARLGELDAAALGEALHARLDHAQRRALDEHAPASLTVPSGQSRRLEYAPGQPPVLAVKLQELFGLADTPRIARGRVPVTLHLLSPAQRPIQVTQDLRGFWERTYPDVRKELKGRYPRHPWPDDPWSAEPTARAKRRV